MSNVIEILVKALVDNPDQVDVRVNEGPDSTTYEVHVAEDDLGKVIGKDGKIAHALRTIAKAAATKSNRKAFVEIVS